MCLLWCLGQSRDAPTNDRETNTPGAHSHHHYNPKKHENNNERRSSTDPTATKRYPNPVRRLSRLMSRGLLESSSDSSCEFQEQQANQMLVPTVEVDPEVLFLYFLII